MFQQFHVLLRPGEVRLARRAHPFARRAGWERAFEVPATRGGADEPWRPCMQRLAETLAELGGGSGSLRVVVSDHFARYVLVPWSADLVADSERSALARITFSEVFGPAADAWTIVMDEQPAGCPSFACAVDRVLLQTLHDLAKALRLRLTSLTPALSDRINRHRRALSGEAFCLASLEPGRVTFAFRHAHAWTAVRSRRLDGPIADRLAGTLLQEAAVSAVQSGGMLYLIGEDAAALPAFDIPDWKVVPLSDGPASPAPGPSLVAVPESN